MREGGGGVTALVFRGATLRLPGEGLTSICIAMKIIENEYLYNMRKTNY